ncbi:MAG: IS3 family transposase [Pseudoclavibacter sp.]
MYGRRKMTALLRRQDLAVSKRQVDRLMRQLGINGLVRERACGPRSRIATPLVHLIYWIGTSPRPRRTGGWAHAGLGANVRPIYDDISSV